MLCYVIFFNLWRIATRHPPGSVFPCSRPTWMQSVSKRGACDCGEEDVLILNKLLYTCVSRIADKHGSFDRIHQMVPMWPPSNTWFLGPTNLNIRGLAGSRWVLPCIFLYYVVAWRSGGIVRRMNKVTLYVDWAWLVLGWLIVFGWVHHFVM